MAGNEAERRDGRWPLGCQARPWLQTLGREALKARLPEVMVQIAAIGFSGFETALDCLPLDDPEAFHEASARANGLVLCGAHTGGKWWDAAGAESIAPLVDRARRLPALGCRRLVVSMQPLPPGATDEQIDRVAETLEQLGRACRQAADVDVAFHNHAAELADDARVIGAIVERCAAVGLGADLGWVAHAGMDVAAFLRRFGRRIAYLHVRDVTEFGPQGGFVEVGRGVLDYGAILGALDAVGYAGWLVAESEFTEHWRGATDPRETARAQFGGLRAALAAAGPAHPSA